MGRTCPSREKSGKVAGSRAVPNDPIASMLDSWIAGAEEHIRRETKIVCSPGVTSKLLAGLDAQFDASGLYDCARICADADSAEARQFRRSMGNTKGVERLCAMLVGEDAEDKSGAGIMRQMQILFKRKSLVAGAGTCSGPGFQMVSPVLEAVMAVLTALAQADPDLRARVAGSGALGILGVIVLGHKADCFFDCAEESKAEAAVAPSRVEVPSGLLQSLRLLSKLIVDHEKVRSGEVTTADPERREKEFERLRKQCLQCGVDVEARKWIGQSLDRASSRSRGTSRSAGSASGSSSESCDQLFRVALDIAQALGEHEIAAAKSAGSVEGGSKFAVFAAETLDRFLDAAKDPPAPDAPDASVAESTEPSVASMVRSARHCDALEQCCGKIFQPLATAILALGEAGSEADSRPSLVKSLVDKRCDLRRLLGVLGEDGIDRCAGSSDDDSDASDEIKSPQDGASKKASNSALLGAQLRVAALIVLGNRLLLDRDQTAQLQEIPVSVVERALVLRQSDAVRELTVLSSSTQSDSTPSEAETEAPGAESSAPALVLEGDIRRFLSLLSAEDAGFDKSMFAHCDGCGAQQTAQRGLKKCGRCRRVGYCSVECQKAAWPTHKSVCEQGK